MQHSVEDWRGMAWDFSFVKLEEIKKLEKRRTNFARIVDVEIENQITAAF